MLLLSLLRRAPSRTSIGADAAAAAAAMATAASSTPVEGPASSPSPSPSPPAATAAPPPLLDTNIAHTKVVTVDDGSGTWPRRADGGYTRPNLVGMEARAFFANAPRPVVSSLAGGRVMGCLGGSVYAVQLQGTHFSPVVEVGARVHVVYGRSDEHEGVTRGGIVVRINGSGTIGVLLDNNSLDMAVPPEMVVIAEGRAKYVEDAAYLAVVDWVRTAGVGRRIDQETMACVLYQRGWRADRLHLLEASDVHCVTSVPKSVRMSIMDKAEWQRDHHRQMRQLLRERVKERDFRYRLTKYSGVVSASMAFLGISFAFGWNVKNYRRQQRKHQLSLAVDTLVATTAAGRRARPAFPFLQLWKAEGEGEGEGEDEHSGSSTGADTPGSGSGGGAPTDAAVVAASAASASQTGGGVQAVERPLEERQVRRVLRRLDPTHPRIVVLTGYSGCGKSTVARAAIAAEGVPAIHVDIRGSEDTLRSVVKALGVQNIDVCGDLLDFVAEACQESTRLSGKTPLLVLKLREGNSLKRVYNEAVALACDRRLCHLVIEVAMESLTMATTSLPRLDFYTVPNFNREQALQYTQHTIDPLSLTHFIETVGTNSNDLDELFAAVHQRRASPTEYANQKLMKAMRRIYGVCANDPEVRAALRQLAALPFEDGQHAGVDATTLGRPLLADVVICDPVHDTWRFRSKVLHTATRSCWV